MVAALLVLFLYSSVLFQSSATADESLTFSDPGPVVMTEYGAVKGKVEKSANVFNSIPYAAPPVGNLRFAAPVPAKPWAKTLNVDGEPSACPQFEFIKGTYIGSEDCLHLHIYAPNKPNKAAGGETLLPVIVWMFGGAFVFGDSREFGWYDGVNLVDRHDVVVVALNYRVGALGYLAHEHLQNEDGDRTTGNMGVQDQRLGLKWVQDNIKAFGGDPSRVTIWGESSGAISVCHHIANGAHKGLFSAAIMDSGNCNSRGMFQPLASALEFGNTFATDVVGCNNSTATEFLTCMRAAPVQKILQGTLPVLLTSAETATDEAGDFSKALLSGLKTVRGDVPPAQRDQIQSSQHEDARPLFYPLMTWTPVVDGSKAGIPDIPINLIRSGRGNEVPVLLGSNHNEGSIFLPFMPQIVEGVSFPLKKGDTERVVRDLYPDSAAVKRILDAYPASEFQNETGRTSFILRDCLFRCPSRRLARVLATKKLPAFLYQFTYHNEWPDSLLLGAYHTSELNYVWGNPFPAHIRSYFTQSDRAMRDAMGQYWTNFAKYHSPNGEKQPGGGSDDTAAFTWPGFNLKTEQSIQLEVPLKTVSFLSRDVCDVFDSFEGLE